MAKIKSKMTWKNDFSKISYFYELNDFMHLAEKVIRGWSLLTLQYGGGRFWFVTAKYLDPPLDIWLIFSYPLKLQPNIFHPPSTSRPPPYWSVYKDQPLINFFKCLKSFNSQKYQVFPKSIFQVIFHSIFVILASGANVAPWGIRTICTTCSCCPATMTEHFAFGLHLWVE